MLRAPRAQAKHFAIFSTLESITGVVGERAVGESENFLDYANRRLCTRQKLGGMTGAKAKTSEGRAWPLAPV